MTGIIIELGIYAAFYSGKSLFDSIKRNPLRYTIPFSAIIVIIMIAVEFAVL